jgi:hypothetical protein
MQACITLLPIDMHVHVDFLSFNLIWPITVAEQSKAWAVFSRSEAVIVGSKPTQSMDVWCVCVCVCVCVRSVFVLSCIYAEALRRANHSSKKSYRLCIDPRKNVNLDTVRVRYKNNENKNNNLICFTPSYSNPFEYSAHILSTVEINPILFMTVIEAK